MIMDCTLYKLKKALKRKMFFFKKLIDFFIVRKF